MPNDGPADRLSCPALPEQRGFTLIGNTDAGNVCGLTQTLAEYRADAFEYGLPDRLGLVLYPTRLREDLRELMIDAT